MRTARQKIKDQKSKRKMTYKNSKLNLKIRILVIPEFVSGDFNVNRYEFYILLCNFTLCILIFNIVAETALGL